MATAPNPPPEKLKMLTDRLQGVASLIIIIGAVFTAIAWAGGGLHPDSVNQIATLNSKITEIQNQQSKQAADIQASQTRQTTDIQNSLSVIVSKIEALPRPSDYAAHMAAIDTSLARLGQQLQTDEVNSARLETMVQSLIDGTQAKTVRPR